MWDWAYSQCQITRSINSVHRAALRGAAEAQRKAARDELGLPEGELGLVGRVADRVRDAVEFNQARRAAGGGRGTAAGAESGLKPRSANHSVAKGLGHRFGL